jgi:hypothetical protein
VLPIVKIQSGAKGGAGQEGARHVLFGEQPRISQRSKSIITEKNTEPQRNIPGDNIGGDGVDGETPEADNTLQGRVEEQEIVFVGTLETHFGAPGHVFLASSGHGSDFFTF